MNNIIPSATSGDSYSSQQQQQYRAQSFSYTDPTLDFSGEIKPSKYALIQAAFSPESKVVTKSIYFCQTPLEKHLPCDSFLEHSQ